MTPASEATGSCRERFGFRLSRTRRGSPPGLPSLVSATNPPCKWVISRTSSPSGVSRVSTGIQVGIGLGKVVRIAHLERCATSSKHCHPDRARLTGEPGSVVVRPKRRWRKVWMELSRDLRLSERVSVGSARSGDDDAAARKGDRLNVLRQLAAPRGTRDRDLRCPRYREGCTGSETVLQQPPSSYRLHFDRPSRTERGTKGPSPPGPQASPDEPTLSRCVDAPNRVAGAILGSGGREGLGVHISPLAPLTRGSSLGTCLVSSLLTR